MTFGKLLNIMNEERDAQHHQDSKAMRAIRIGLNINEEFWDEFIQVCNNSSDLADLLDVSTTAISSWASRIHQAVDKVKAADAKGDGEEKPKHKIIDTGDEFAGGMAIGNPY